MGKDYAANTLGAIVGALSCSILLISWTGTQQAQQIFVALSTGSALLLFASILWPALPKTVGTGVGGRGLPHLWRGGVLGIMACMGWVLTREIPQIPWELVACGRYQATYDDDKTILYVGEGMNATVAVTEMADGVRNFHVSGKVEASTEARDMRLQRMLSHIPALLHPNPRSSSWSVSVPA